jgi:NADPH-dependent ferric siderophore reductase
MIERRRTPQVHQARVLRTEQLTPHMIRVVVGGETLAGFEAGAFTDHYVKLLFAQPGVDYPVPLDMEAVRRDLPREQWPRIRTYTVRAWDPSARELTIDFVYHGDEGIAGPWAVNARPGDPLAFQGPGGAYAPDPDVDWHLLAGDESALPAIAAAIERLPDGVPARIFIEVAGAEEEQKLSTSASVELVWVHRGDRVVGEALVEAVREMEFPAGVVQAFVHGEATFVKQLRHLLRVERGVDRDRLSISGYWRRGTDEDGWQSTKRDWNQQVEEDESRALSQAGPPAPPIEA